VAKKRESRYVRCVCTNILGGYQLATTARYWCLYCMYIRAARGSGFRFRITLYILETRDFSFSSLEQIDRCRLPSQRTLRECTGNRSSLRNNNIWTSWHLHIQCSIGTISKNTVGHCQDTYPGVVYVYVYIYIYMYTGRFETTSMSLKRYILVRFHKILFQSLNMTFRGMSDCLESPCQIFRKFRI